MAEDITEIPLISARSQELNIVLNEQNCTIKVFFAGAHLFLDLSIDDTLIRAGALLIPNCAAFTEERISFSGNFFIVDTVSAVTAQSNPTIAELGGRFRLYYVSAETAEEIRSLRYD